MILFIFLFSLFMVVYVYLGYPIIATMLSKLYPGSVQKKPYEPLVSIVIAAYNEESGIAETIQNKLQLDYPQEKLEIVVISDGSTDKTDDIVESFSEPKVRLLRQAPRAGKTSALNLAIPTLMGEIIVFSDANSLYEPQALRALMANFSDPEVGYVTGKMIYVDPDGSVIGDGCSAYMKYENYLRTVETWIGSVVGVDGGIDAMRKELYRPMNADQLPDFVQPLKVVEQGCRVVYEPEALLKESALSDDSDEYRMRVRVSLRAFWALSDMRQLLFMPQNKMFSWQLWSHKVLRYLCFIFLFGAFVSNLFILGQSWIYQLALILQCMAYLIAAFAPQLAKIGYQSRPINFVRYFALLNLACAHAFVKFVMRKKQVVWTPRKG